MFLAAFTSALQAYPQAVHRKTAWLSRDFRSTCPHAEQRWLVNAGLIFSTRPGALSSSRRTSRPQPGPQDAPGSARPSGRTFRPGFSRVPLAERVMFLICRSSTRITSNRRAMSVLAFSAQSLRRSVSRALSRAIGQPHPAAAVRAPLGAGELALQPPQPGPLPRGQAGHVQQLPGGQGRGDRHAPVDAHRLAVTRRRDRLRESPRRRHASVRPGPWSPGRTSHPAVPARDQRNRTHPAFGTQTSPVFRLSRRTSHCRPRRPTIRNPSSRPALRHDGRPAGFAGSKNAAIAWAKSRSACCWTIWEPAASHGCSARAWVSCRHCSR